MKPGPPAKLVNCSSPSIASIKSRPPNAFCNCGTFSVLRLGNGIGQAVATSGQEDIKLAGLKALKKRLVLPGLMKGTPARLSVTKFGKTLRDCVITAPRI